MAEKIKGDSIVVGSNNVVHKLIADYPGGVELDVSGVGTEYNTNNGVIPAGTPIYKDAGAFKPMLASQAGGQVVGEETVYTQPIGVLYIPVTVAEPYASIAIKAVVNESKMPFALVDGEKASMPGITFY